MRDQTRDDHFCRWTGTYIIMVSDPNEAGEYGVQIENVFSNERITQVFEPGENPVPWIRQQVGKVHNRWFSKRKNKYRRRAA